jgi:hypothetical protein
MINQVNGTTLQSHYGDLAGRSGWRDEMLNQMLEKVRELAPSVGGVRTSSGSDVPVKGRLVDVFA